MARKGAMTKNPSPQKAASNPKPAPTQEASGPSKWERTGPGTYKDQYGNIKRGQKTAPKKDLSPGATTQPTQTQAPTPPTPQELAEQGFRGSADLFGQMQERFQGFDPMQAQAQYNPVFSQEMDRARQNILGQFDRRNAQQFAQERQMFETSMANRGIAPGGEQYNRELQALTDRQDRARQEAMSAAEQAAQGVQQQYYGQAMQTAQMPYDIYGSTFAPVYGAGIGQVYGQQTQQAQMDFNAQQAELDRKQRRWEVRNTPRGGGGGGGGGPQLTPYDILERQQLLQGEQKQPNPWAQGVSSFVGSFGQGLGQQLGQSVGSRGGS